jgi:hypothetical protein
MMVGPKSTWPDRYCVRRQSILLYAWSAQERTYYRRTIPVDTTEKKYIRRCRACFPLPSQEVFFREGSIEVVPLGNVTQQHALRINPKVS